MSEERTRVSNSVIAEQVKQIEKCTNDIKEIVTAMPKCAARDAFEYSVVNLEKKIERFTTERVKVTSDEKDFLKTQLAEYRKKKALEQGKEGAISNPESNSMSDDKETNPESKPVRSGKKHK